ncbi:hypothetical protein GCK72_010994 [Caenorhabditis remanei]|uniref:C2H2-type domain-containing protein n=1 Tax=Caenorhabditis remanei TaxID=31234 RepID=A0A6A5H8M8_CAERE|nr:hypothetical protein GCK72_010994 [Caenorhabditis remanei]KAF1762732.1 hypothetical protein GCK72_010994 [Caenorhabditis remanei]
MMPSTSNPNEKNLEDVGDPNSAQIPNPEEDQAEELEEIIVVSGEEMQANGEEMQVVDQEEIIFAEDGEYIEYDAIVSVSSERNLLYDMYQPQATVNGTFVCKICLRTGKNTEYPDRASFVAHRYKCHGSFNNNVICPIADCREVYASLYTLRRHLSQQHELPIEIHLQTFTNIGEFEKFRHLIELASGCRYMMHTKQPKYRRQVMHCSKSEHKLVLQTQKHRLPRERMLKEGSACPSVISYRVNASNGEVHAFMQLYHVGHAPDSDAEHSNADAARPMDVVFPLKPSFWADRPMQFVQIDVHEMPPAVYGSKVYESILIVMCLKSKFMWAKPLYECTRTAIGRLLNTIFNEYGVPEGFSTTFHPTYIRDTMKSLESVYAIDIREVWNEPPAYSLLERWVLELAEMDLLTRNRWVEQLQFVVMEYNQRPIPERLETPFERMFRRKAPNLYHNGQQQDMMTAKFRRYHEELRREDEGMEENLSATFEPGQKVFLRKGITKPRRGNNTQFYFGIIGEHDPSNQYYPYKVHYSSTDSPWPTERNMFAWVSVFDLLPTIHGISEMTNMEKEESIASYMCSCPGIESNKNFDMSAVGKPARAASHCLLFRNLLCSNHMSRYCCKTLATGPCRYHSLYPENDESYAKMDAVLTAFLAQSKDIEKRELRRDKTMEDPGPIRRLVQAEIDRMRLNGEDFDVIDEEEFAPPEMEEHHQMRSHEDVQGSTEQIDIEGIEEEEILEPTTSLEHREASDVAFEYEDPKEDGQPGPSESQSPLKRNREKSPEESQKRKKVSDDSEEFLPSESSSIPSITTSPSSRRASARRTIRPKNLEDYIVE